MRIGYIRVSTREQNIARQEVLMEQLEVERVYIDKMSGKNTNRPQLKEMLDYVRQGDTVIVESISRIARNTKDLLEIIEILRSKGVIFISKKESIDTESATGKFMLTIFGAVAELERAYLLDRQMEGIQIAKEEGKYKGRVPIKVDEGLFNIFYRQWKDGEITAKKFMAVVNLKPNTFYRKVAQYEKDKGIYIGRKKPVKAI